MSNHTEHRSYDENYSGSDAVDKHATEEGNHYVGEGVESIKQIELELSNLFSISLQVVFYRYLQSLG